VLFDAGDEFFSTGHGILSAVEALLKSGFTFLERIFRHLFKAAASWPAI
jgi:hypothetical protein